MIRGGWVPGGSWRRMVCDTAVTCALAVSRRAFGCKNILIIDWPLTVVDSMCSMLSTVVVRTRSYWVVIRPSISSGFRPVNCQATAITGMLMLGKMSVGVRRTIAGLASRISSATTTKVYGRCRATLTIHMLCRRPTAQSSYCSHGCLPSLSMLEGMRSFPSDETTVPKAASEGHGRIDLDRRVARTARRLCRAKLTDRWLWRGLGASRGARVQRDVARQLLATRHGVLRRRCRLHASDRGRCNVHREVHAGCVGDEQPCAVVELVGPRGDQR